MFEISLIAVIIILFVHWVADFVLQTDEMAKGKSSSWKMLLAHTAVYSAVWLMLSNFLIITNILNPIFYLFAPITFIFHTITDYFTSRINKKLWLAGQTHDFFLSIGFDQFLHYIQLLILYYLL